MQPFSPNQSSEKDQSLSSSESVEKTSFDGNKKDNTTNIQTSNSTVSISNYNASSNSTNQVLHQWNSNSAVTHGPKKKDMETNSQIDISTPKKGFIFQFHYSQSLYQLSYARVIIFQFH
jgi:hypothetical protein